MNITKKKYKRNESENQEKNINCQKTNVYRIPNLEKNNKKGQKFNTAYGTLAKNI